MKRISLFALLSFFIAGVAVAQERVISVQGAGAVAVVPDGYSLTFVLQEEGDVVAKMNQTLHHQLSDIVEFLKTSGVKESAIQSMQVRLSPRYVPSNQGRVPSGFVLSREVRVSQQDTANFDHLIDGVMQRGADRIDDFRFTVSNEAQAYEKALMQAASDARQKARLLTAQMGVSLGEVIAISESGGNMPMPVMRAEMVMKDASPSLPGQQQISARITMQFLIE
ncbi:SIMPL domain-containing protein [Alteromonas sp. CYL-A6]|uniref:SIMPL domain-containing protein n=1 Tax=Alteromonas nitratireducens TaxID=3390813 RepID=UPI0034B0AA10